ncbi:ADP-ribose pyrophosphatase [Leifsonia sp. AK011]|uniref:NUDIX domain-containing protein n=1 Tax=Leifsonia sp. AK011 TaxID=2723075 RepID=UPI0015CA3FDB|nr:NUDIX hydrolase [Leifsonia sp. AK011]NYF10544.1 ADP-ribose pyrophosphatase [Leifsonia sp. AK011]
MPDTSSEPLADEHVALVVTSSTREFAGRVWDIRRETFGMGGTDVVRDFVDHTGAVAVLAMDEEGRVLAIQQYRHPVRSRDWELPAGLLDMAGEDPLVAAQRELAEEADLVASEWNVLSDIMTSPGGSNEVIRVYLARGVSASDETFDRTEEEAEIVLRWVTLDDAVQAVLERRVQNSILCVAVLAAHAARERGWSTLGAADAAWPQRDTVRA